MPQCGWFWALIGFFSGLALGVLALHAEWWRQRLDSLLYWRVGVTASRCTSCGQVPCAGTATGCAGRRMA